MDKGPNSEDWVKWSKHVLLSLQNLQKNYGDLNENFVDLKIELAKKDAASEEKEKAREKAEEIAKQVAAKEAKHKAQIWSSITALIVSLCTVAADHYFSNEDKTRTNQKHERKLQRTSDESNREESSKSSR